MKFTRWTRRLLQTTRGEIILLLRQAPSTVADMASALDLTQNAIRAHIATLERDGLVHQKGERAGFRKPHFCYELTPEAGEIFPKAYGPILNQLVSVLKERVGSETTESMLREVGQRVASADTLGDDVMFEERLEHALKSLEKLGGHATIAREDDKVIIRGSDCPLATVTADHGEICTMVATFLTDVIGAPVVQTCQRKPSPQCCFEVQASTNVQ